MYTRICNLGHGTYGNVVSVKRLKDDSIFACKMFYVSSSSTRLKGAIHLREADFMKRCDHPFLLKAIEVYYGSPFSEPLNISQKRLDQVFIITTQAKGNAHSFFNSHTIIATHAKRIMFQITQALHYLHHHGVTHRDIKSSNVLIWFDPKWGSLINASLADFGMCKPLTTEHLNSMDVGTGIYKSPELILGYGTYDLSSDIWSLATWYYELFNGGEYLFSAKGKTDLSVLSKMFDVRGGPSHDAFLHLTEGCPSPIISYQGIRNIPKRDMHDLFIYERRKVDFDYPQKEEYISTLMKTFESQPDDIPNFGTINEYAELLDWMLDLDPRKRPTIVQVLESPFFSKIPKDDDPLWFGLRHRPVDPCPHIVLEKIKNDTFRKQGLHVIGLYNSSSTTIETVWRIGFLSLDIFDRVTVFLEKRERLSEFRPVELAISCSYIATKYLIDEKSAALDFIFKNTLFNEALVLEYEKIILTEVLDWMIYRKTVYDLLRTKVSPATLFKFLTKYDEAYNSKTIEEIAVIFEETVK
jgi:serine/threonine protein kinase